MFLFPIILASVFEKRTWFWNWFPKPFKWCFISFIFLHIITFAAIGFEPICEAYETPELPILYAALIFSTTIY